LNPPQGTPDSTPYSVSGFFKNEFITIMLKESINKRGLKFKWVADKLNINYSSFRVYLNNEAIMPEEIKISVKELLKQYSV